MITLIFLRDCVGYVWVDMLTLPSYSFLCLQITRWDIRPQQNGQLVWWLLMHDHFNLPQRLCWVWVGWQLDMLTLPSYLWLMVKINQRSLNLNLLFQPLWKMLSYHDFLFLFCRVNLSTFSCSPTSLLSNKLSVLSRLIDTVWSIYSST